MDRRKNMDHVHSYTSLLVRQTHTLQNAGMSQGLWMHQAQNAQDARWCSILLKELAGYAQTVDIFNHTTKTIASIFVKVFFMLRKLESGRYAGYCGEQSDSRQAVKIAPYVTMSLSATTVAPCRDCWLWSVLGAFSSI